MDVCELPYDRIVVFASCHVICRVVIFYDLFNILKKISSRTVLVMKERRLEFRKNIAHECSNYSSLEQDFDNYVMRYWRFRSEISFVCALSSCARLKNWMNWTTSDEYDIGFGEGRMSAKGKWRSDILREETTRKERIQEDWIHDRTDWNLKCKRTLGKRIHVNRNDDSTSSSYVSLTTDW